MTEGKYARILAKIQVSAILQMQDIWGNDLLKNIVRLNPSFTSVSCSDDKEITYPEVWCTCKVVVWLILMKKLLFVVGFTLLLPAPPSSPIDKFPFCIKQEQTQHFTLTC